MEKFEEPKSSVSKRTGWVTPEGYTPLGLRLLTIGYPNGELQSLEKR